MVRAITKAAYVVHELREASSKIPNRPRGVTVMDMLLCGVVYGCSPSNYYHFDFAHASLSERATYVTHRRSERLMRTFNQPEMRVLMEDKIQFAQRYEKYYRRKWLSTSEMSFDEFADFCRENSKMICKPRFGGQGRGIHVYSGQKNVEMMFREMKNDEPAIIEEWIHQHEDMARLYPDAVNPLRIQTLLTNGEAHCLAGTVTIGNGKQFSNASSNAIFALLDMKRGVICTDGCDYDYHLYKNHPVTGVPIYGFRIPYWNAAIEMVKEAALVTPQLGYIGWDIAITPDGPVIIEANNDPGYTAYQLPVLTKTHTGILPLYKKYL